MWAFLEHKIHQGQSVHRIAEAHNKVQCFMVSVWETSSESLLYFLNDFGPDFVSIASMENLPEQLGVAGGRVGNPHLWVHKKKKYLKICFVHWHFSLEHSKQYTSNKWQALGNWCSFNVFSFSSTSSKDQFPVTNITCSRLF